jgi:hypothetical protein
MFHSLQDNGHKHTKRPLDYILAGKLARKIQMSCIKSKECQATVSKENSEIPSLG